LTEKTNKLIRDESRS